MGEGWVFVEWLKPSEMKKINRLRDSISKVDRDVRSMKLHKVLWIRKPCTLIFLSVCPAYDRFVSNLKSSLSIEKQKNSLLGEEVKIKKGSVERLRSELENTKEQLQYLKEEKGKTTWLCFFLVMCVEQWGFVHTYSCTVVPDHWYLGPGGGDSHMKQMGMLVVSLRGVNFGFWSRLGCSGQSAKILCRQGLV